MTTRDTIQAYFDRLQQKNGWERSLSDAVIFTSYASPGKRVIGRAAYLERRKLLLHDHHPGGQGLGG